MTGSVVLYPSDEVHHRASLGDCVWDGYISLGSASVRHCPVSNIVQGDHADVEIR